VAQALVVIQVFISQRHPEHALPDQCPDRVFDQVRIALIDETPRQPIDQSDRLIRPPEQQRPGIRADRPSVERRHHAASFYA
jgi:hypothetical protein